MKKGTSALQALLATLIACVRSVGAPKTPKMAKFVETVRPMLTAEDIERHIEGCIGCGNCANACPLYLATNLPQHHSKVKADLFRRIYQRYMTLKGRVLGAVFGWGDLSDSFLDTCSDSVFGTDGSCTMCGRCSTACMQGVAPQRLFKLMRAGLNACDIMPRPLALMREEITGTTHTFGPTWQPLVDQTIARLREEGLDVPVDRQGAEWLVVPSTFVNASRPTLSRSLVEVLNRSGVSWTTSSTYQDTGTEVHAVYVDLPLAEKFVEGLAREVRRLGCRGLIIGECSCDIRFYFVDAAPLLKKLGLEIIYLDAFLLDLYKQGRLPLAKLPEGSFTLHDPCWTVRKAGYGEVLRELLSACVADFREMTPNRERNYCCGGGTGAMRMWPSTALGPDNRRMQMACFKARQIRNTGADTVVTPCTTCVRSLSDTVKQYELPATATMLIDVVHTSMMAAFAAAEGGAK